MKIPTMDRRAQPSRSAAKRNREIVTSTEADRVRHETALGLADELELGVLGADRESLSEAGAQRVSLWQRRARAIRELVELTGGPRID